MEGLPKSKWLIPVEKTRKLRSSKKFSTDEKEVAKKRDGLGPEVEGRATGGRAGIGRFASPCSKRS